MRILNYTVVLLFSLACSSSTFATPATRPSDADKTRALKQAQEDLQSNDPARVAAAVQLVRDVILIKRNDFGVFQGVDLLLKAKKFDDVDSVCVASMLDHADVPYWVSKCQRARVMALLGLGKNDQALSAAKSYFNVALFNESNDAINLVILCLGKATPEGKDLARRFKRQQAAWASPSYVPPTTRPSPTTQTSAGSDPDNLGDPILATINVDTKPYDDAINNTMADDYKSYVAKANLLLLADQPAEARDIFEQALDIAPASQGTAAIENVARAIRAQAGCLGPANAYILSLRKATAPK